MKNDLSDSFVRDLGPFPGLIDISLGGSKITEKSLPLLGQMKSLQILGLDNLGSISDLSALKNLKLEVLSLRSCSINAKTVKQIAKFQNLRLLRLDRTPADDADLLVLAQLPRLKELDVVGCALISPKGLAAFKKLKPDCKVVVEDDPRIKKLKSAKESFAGLESNLILEPVDKKF